MAKVGIVLDKLYVDHDNGPGHPETFERILAIVDMLQFTKMMDEVVRIEPKDATREDITRVHTEEHFDKIASTKGKPKVFLDADTSTCSVTFDAALRAAGGTISAIDSVLDGEVDRAFPIVRPPGHHAEADRPMGFCFFNNIAVGASYLTDVKGLERVMVIDWDVHHGNGTQNIFYDSNKVLFFSTHQFPFYPGTGSSEEIGTGEGAGYTVNVPMQPGMGDNEFIRIFEELLKPVIDQYKPQFILVSAGFDIFFEDPLGGMKVSPEGFAKLTRLLTDEADKICDGNIIFLLEGGYNLDGLWISTKEMLEEMLDKKQTSYDIGNSETKVDELIEKTKKVYSDYWKF